MVAGQILHDIMYPDLRILVAEYTKVHAGFCPSTVASAITYAPGSPKFKTCSYPTSSPHITSIGGEQEFDKGFWLCGT